MSDLNLLIIPLSLALAFCLVIFGVYQAFTRLFPRSRPLLFLWFFYFLFGLVFLLYDTDSDIDTFTRLITSLHNPSVLLLLLAAGLALAVYTWYHIVTSKAKISIRAIPLPPKEISSPPESPVHPASPSRPT